MLPPSKRAFSLVELSIVLVILGLLTGGILAGQSLIRAAELRSISTDYSRITASVQSFRDRYMALPGDMANAQSFWGAAHATPATCATTDSTSALTCNGNGNGIIFPSTGSNESYRFWQHLANAGLMEGSYSGITQGSTSWSSTAANSPAGKISNGLWVVYNWGTLSAQTYAFDGVYNNSLSFGGMNPNSTPGLAILKPEELWNIDIKMDDGKPAVGKIALGAGGNALSTSTTATGTTAQQAASLSADYLLTGTSKTCTIFFRDQF